MQEGKGEWAWVQGVRCVGLLSWEGDCYGVVWGWPLPECGAQQWWGELCVSVVIEPLRGCPGGRASRYGGASAAPLVGSGELVYCGGGGLAACSRGCKLEGCGVA